MTFQESKEVTNPEKARKMRTLIDDAKKVFASEVSRREYDNELSNLNKSQQRVDPSEERYQSLIKWKEQARSYYNKRQYDLAKAAIDKALSYVNNDDDDSLFYLAADIYRLSGNNVVALNYINNAIVLSPEVALYYLCKGLIYDEMANEVREYDYQKAFDNKKQMREMFRTAIYKAEASGDVASQAQAMGALAYELYFQQPFDREQAIKLAEQSHNIGGDSWGNADRVLNEEKAIREEIKKRNRKRECSKRKYL